MKKMIWILALAGLLSACSSGIKLSDVPVEDKAGSSVNNTSTSQSKEANKPAQAGAPANSSASQANPNPNTISSTSISGSAQDPKNNAASSAAPAVTAPQADAGMASPANAVKKIYFDYDSYIVKPEFQSVIESHAQYLKTNPRSRVSLEGHTDERGSREYNLALGQRRADAVRQSLTLLGVNVSQIESVSFGEEKPEVLGSDETAYAKNRRVEFFYK